ncbi:unnamed protein product [Larinioides sclopetarius]|uniref:Ankyrin 2 n=2 Tax=Araneidae TaxID=6913 RepID=A0AAV2BLQ6_9ARAC
MLRGREEVEERVTKQNPLPRLRELRGQSWAVLSQLSQLVYPGSLLMTSLGFPGLRMAMRAFCELLERVECFAPRFQRRECERRDRTSQERRQRQCCHQGNAFLQACRPSRMDTDKGNTALHIASLAGQEEVVRVLVQAGANVNSQSQNGFTPLYMAAQENHDSVVSFLLANGANQSLATEDGFTPLAVALQQGHDKVVAVLLENDTKGRVRLPALHIAAKKDDCKAATLLLQSDHNPDVTSKSGFTPLHIAAHYGNENIAKILLNKGADVNYAAKHQITPLHVASKWGKMNMVVLLLENGANIEASTRDGLTPLHCAARSGHDQVVDLLLEKGAPFLAKTKNGLAPLHMASQGDHVDSARILLYHKAPVDDVTVSGLTPLHVASFMGCMNIVIYLIQNGANPDVPTVRGETPLHLAARANQTDIIRILLRNGASVDARAREEQTPLHIAARLGNVDIVSLLLQHGAAVDATTKDMYTALHIAAKEDQEEVAACLLDHGASLTSTTKKGFTPLHLAAKYGNIKVARLLIQKEAPVDAQGKASLFHDLYNGLTPLHLCAQDDRVNVAHILVAHKAEVDPQTKAGYTPLHVASHFGQVNMVRFLLQNRADVQTTTSLGYTPLHQAAQQGHTLVVNLLLENEASPNVTTTQGQTPLSIAQRLGYISVVETLKVVTETTITTTTTTVTEEKYKVVAPETMQETFMTDSEDEGGADFDEAAIFGKPTHATHVYLPYLEGQNFQMTPIVDEDKLSPQHVTPVESGFSEKFSPDNIDLTRAPVHAGFLVSFMVDARGGAMRGCRHSGVRIIIPPRKASMPMRITCRYLRKEKLIHPPPLMEGEACASRILEMGPVGARFLGPVIIEVPHFASTRGKEREITILRSDTGESWREHVLEASEEAVQEVLNESFEGEDFPQYFAIITRIRQEVHGVGPEGGMVSSTVVPQVQAIFPEGALTKKIRVGLQAQPIAPELVAKLLGNRVAVSPIVTVEPRRRKFHKPITLTIPVPQAATKGMINQYSGDAPTLRLLCSITGSTKSGGSSKAQWEDVTGSTPLTFVNDCVSFTTTVSARFWLMDCRQVNEVTRFATELYQEAVYVPFMSKFVIFAKRHDPYEAQLRVFCMTDDKEDKTLECQEHFTEIAKSRDVEVLEGKLQFLEFAGNIAPVTKSGEQLQLPFQAFHENRLPFAVRVKDPHIEPMGRIAFMREPKAARGEPPLVPICNLNVALPEIILTDSSDVIELVTLEKRYDFIQEAGLTDLRLSDIAQGLDKDWVSLAQQLDMSEHDIGQIQADNTCDQSEQALMMLRLWLQKSGSKATGNELEKGLRKINREDIIKNCMFNVELEAESAAETSSETGSLFERDQISQALTDDKDLICQTADPSKCSADDNVDALFPKCKKMSNQHSVEAANNDLNAKVPSEPFDISESDSNIIINKTETNSILQETQTYAKQHEFWPSIPVTSPNGASVVPANSNCEQNLEKSNLNNKEISEHKDIPSKEESLNIIISENGNKSDRNAESCKSSDACDFGYCSMDKVTCASPVSDSDNASKSHSEQSGPESPLPTSPGLDQGRTLDEKALAEQTPELQSPANEDAFQMQPVVGVPLRDASQEGEKSLHSPGRNTDTGVSHPAAESTEAPAVKNESSAVCAPAGVCVTDGSPVTIVTTLQFEDAKSENSKDARIRRASKTPPPSPVDETGGDNDNADKIKEILLTQSTFENRFKEENLRGPVEVEQKFAEISGRQELPARLTESETWPSLELDTSQVSISSLPEDEKSEPTTATVSDAVALAADTDESTDDKEPDEDIDDETLSPTKFKDLCSKKVSPTKSVFENKIMFTQKLSASVSSEKILSLQELPLSPVKEVAEIETKETCTSPCSEKPETVKPSQLISTRKGFRTRKKLSPIHDAHKFEPKAPSRVDRGLSPIVVFIAGPSGVENEASDYLVQTYDAPSMEEPKPQPDNYISKSTEMSPNTTFGLKQAKESEPGIPTTKISSATQSSPSISSPSKSSVDEKLSIVSETSSKSTIVVEKSLEENLNKVEKSTSPFSDLMLDTGIGTESPVTADTASSPFLPDVQSPSSVSFQSSTANLVREHCSTQTLHVEMLSAHTSPIDGPFSLQDSNLSFCPTESSLKSDSLDDISKTLGTPSSDNVEPDAVLELVHSQQEFHKASVKDFLQEHMSEGGAASEADDSSREVTEEDALNKILVMESFRNVFATEPPFSIVSSRKLMKKDTDRKKKRKVGPETLAEERLFTLHDQLLSEESALESSTDSGVDLKETTHYSNIADSFDASSSRDDADGLRKVDKESEKAREELAEIEEKLPEIEKQVLTKTSEYDESETSAIYAQEVLEPTIVTSYQSSDIIDVGISNFEVYNVDVVEEVCVKAEARISTGGDDFDRFKSSGRIITEKKSSDVKIKSVPTTFSKEGSDFLEKVEQQLVCKKSIRTFVSPTAEINSIYAQQIFSSLPRDESPSHASVDTKSLAFASEPVKEDTIFPQKSLEYSDIVLQEISGKQELCKHSSVFKEVTRIVTLPNEPFSEYSFEGPSEIDKHAIDRTFLELKSIPFDSTVEEAPGATQVIQTTTVMTIRSPDLQPTDEGQCLHLLRFLATAGH